MDLILEYTGYDYRKIDRDLLAEAILSNCTPLETDKILYRTQDTEYEAPNKSLRSWTTSLKECLRFGEDLYITSRKGAYKCPKSHFEWEEEHFLFPFDCGWDVIYVWQYGQVFLDSSLWGRNLVDIYDDLVVDGGYEASRLEHIL